MSACFQGEDIIGQTWQRNQVSVELKDEAVVEEEKKKNTPWLKVFMTCFYHDVSHEVFCQSSFHFMYHFSHYDLTLIVRKGKYCHSLSYTVTWQGWGWVADISGLCLKLPPPSSYLYRLISTEPFVWGHWEECWNIGANEEGGGGEWKGWYAICLPASLTESLV